MTESAPGVPEERTSVEQASVNDRQSAVSDSDETVGGAVESAADGQEASPARSEKERLEHEGEIAADYLETLLDIADLDGDLEVEVEADRAAVSIVDSEDGTVPRRLVGPNATVLEALQELARLSVQAETGERTRLMLDVGGYRAERRSSLESLGQRVVEDVRADGKRRELDPMTAFERKVVHDAVLAAGLSSESEGEEPNRYVVVFPES